MSWSDLRGVLRSGLVPLIAGVVLVAVLGALMYGAVTVDAPAARGVITLDHARFARGGAPERDVTLPHTWARDGLANDGRGRYRIEFHLDAVPAVPWGLHAARLSSRHEVRLNGHWVHGSALDAAATRRGVPVPTWIDIAPNLLRAGPNELEIEVALDYRAGMSALRLGPEPQLWPRHLRDEALLLIVPRSLNLFGVGLALFMVSIWWRRRSERGLGLFALLMTILSIRNVGYSGTGTATHTPATDVLFYLANVVAAMLMARFALAWAARDWRWFRRAVDLGGGALVLAGLVSVFFDAVQTMRLLTYPLLLASLVPSLVLMVLGTRREAGGTRIALLVGVVMLCLAPLHDYFYIRGLTSVADAYWMPFVAPITLMIFAWTLLDRFTAALGVVEGQAAELEQRVERRTHELAEANAAKTRFLAAASHDLRQPVVSISLLSGLLREQPLPSTARPLIDRIADSVSALNALLKGLLDLSRFDAGIVTPRREAVALRPLLDAALADEREAARRKGLQLRVRAPDLKLLTDPLLAGQIVRNLVGNAVRYTDRGGVLVAARRRGADRVVLQVWDTGRGIAVEHQGAVFDEFVQIGADAGESRGGLGLGLSLVRRATQLLQLPLRLRSRPGRGSCFEVELPLAPAAPMAPQPAAAASPATAPFEGRGVWVLDDEPDVLEALRLCFVAWGAQVRAFDGLAALRTALDDPAVTVPELLVTDQRLRNGSGLQAVAAARGRWPRLAALLVTGDTAPADIAMLQASGVPLLHKPFAAETLLGAARAQLPERAASPV